VTWGTAEQHGGLPETSMKLDDNGQPVFRTFNAARLNDRMIDELIGLCRGVLFDGAVSELEASALLSWMEANREIAQHWPANVLYRRIEQMMTDKHLDSAEQRELIQTLMEITGAPVPDAAAKSGSTALPLCAPLPVVSFPRKLFCFTGKFVSGTRRQVQDAVTALGASAKDSPSSKTHYLVIGSIGSVDWIHSTHGRKIEKAVQLRNEGRPIHIIAEEYWAECVAAVI
jgi:NAD-dependent DNA ligase